MHIDSQLAEQVAAKFMRDLYRTAVPDRSIDFTSFAHRLNVQMQTDAEAREMVSRGIMDAYNAEVAKLTGDKNAIFGDMFDHMKRPGMPQDVSRSVVTGNGSGIVSLPPAASPRSKSFY